MSNLYPEIEDDLKVEIDKMWLDDWDYKSVEEAIMEDWDFGTKRDYGGGALSPGLFKVLMRGDLMNASSFQTSNPIRTKKFEDAVNKALTSEGAPITIRIKTYDSYNGVYVFTLDHSPYTGEEDKDLLDI